MEPNRREDLRGLTINSLIDSNINSTQPHFDHASASDDFFLDQMLSNLTSPQPSWTISSSSTAQNQHFNLDELASASITDKLRLHQIGSDHFLPHGSEETDEVGISSFKTLTHLNGIGGRSVDNLYNGFGVGSGSLQGIIGGNGPAPDSFITQEGGSAQTTPTFAGQATDIGGSNGGGNAAQPRQRVRARRGQATDPHSIAERLRRERIAERMKALQELVPNANKTDKASMLDEIIDYVKFLQLQVKVLSMSRLGGAAAVAPLVADMSSSEAKGGGGGGGTSSAVDCGQSNGTGRGGGDSLTVTEHQVAKLMEEDMGSAMQYLQGKGLCLMPISLATAISTATYQQPRTTKSSPLHFGINRDSPSSPGMSALTVQSANGSAKDGGSDKKS